ncbi:MAG: PBP1A family penicillin-binding protein [Alphaproteobacteria bacterium]|nr:PBP1A family penicillin-binding protein [Alphaproteobacteria bacterium]
MAPRKKKTTNKKKTGRSRAAPKSAGGSSSFLGAFFGRVFRFLFVLGLLAGLALTAFVGWCAWGLPNADQVNPVDAQPSITILADDGSVVARYGGLTGNLVDVKKLPPYVSQAVLAIEDRRFYEHFGIDPLGLARAMWVNIRARHWVQGGSTITQQLAKNLFLTPDKTLRRKVQEALLALWIEHKFTKAQILSAYLNRVYYGAGAYGVDAAARTYFGKPAHDLSIWESAVLAGLLKAPSRYSPASNPKLAAARAKTVIKTMREAGFISAQQEKQEMRHKTIAVTGSSESDIGHYFADWVIDQIDSYVTNNDRDLVIRTTFDPQLQTLAEQKEKALFAKMDKRDKSAQIALVTLSKDGAVLAMIGGRDYAKSQFNRATQAMRQPGSSFKPFVYLAALESGYTPNDMLLDAPFTEGKYRPENYDHEYMGAVSLTQALAHSLNTATVRLLQSVGIPRLMDVTRRLGFSHAFKPELSTGLGASEANLLEMTNAYATIANGGYAVWPYAVLSIEDKNGSVLYQRDHMQHERVFSPRDIANLDGMMVQVIAQGTGQAAQLSKGHTAGKTGTSQDYRDAWFIGYTNTLVTGVWMGKDDDTPMRCVTGGKYPARLWHDYMNEAIDVTLPPQPSFMPYGDSGDSFSKMLGRWSEGDFSGPHNSGGGINLREFKGSTAPPQYNR